MQKITNKQYEEYRKLIDDQEHGRILTPDGLRFICSACNYDPTEIGKIMLENLVKLQAEGAVSMHPEEETDPEAGDLTEGCKFCLDKNERLKYDVYTSKKEQDKWEKRSQIQNVIA